MESQYKIESYDLEYEKAFQLLKQNKLFEAKELIILSVIPGMLSHSQEAKASSNSELIQFINSKLSDVYNTIGYIEKKSENLDVAEQYFKQSLSLHRTPINEFNLRHVHNPNPPDPPTISKKQSQQYFKTPSRPSIIEINDTVKKVYQKKIKTFFKNSKPTILISGHLPIDNTGYSGQTYYMMRCFQELGYNVCVLGWNANNFIKETYYPFTFDEMIDIMRQRIQLTSFKEHNVDKLDTVQQSLFFTAIIPDFPRYIRSPKPFQTLVDIIDPYCIVCLQDIYVLPFTYFTRYTISWLPIHYIPLDHLTKRSIPKFDKLVGLSKFGQKKIQEGLPSHTVDYLYHVLDTTKYKPISTSITKQQEHRVQLRMKWKIPTDAFLITILSNNTEPSMRKAFDVNLNAFIDYAAQNPQAFLYIHTLENCAYNIRNHLESCSDIQGRFLICDQTKYSHRLYHDSDIIEIYQMSTIILSATCSEGFGLPILEAQACGCPVITNNFSTPQELTHYGICTEFETMKYHSDWDAYWSIPSQSNIVKALCEIETWTPEIHEEKQHTLVDFVKKFSYSTIRDQWKDILPKPITTVSIQQRLFDILSLSKQPVKPTLLYKFLPVDTVITDPDTNKTHIQTIPNGIFYLSNPNYLFSLNKFNQFIKKVQVIQYYQNNSQQMNKLQILYETVHNYYLDNQTQKQTKQIPSELLDPIMLSLITEPIVLPSSNVIIDKNTIDQHLIHKQTNPFTNEPLTQDMITEFNNQPAQQLKIKEFIEKLTKWKQST